jgi:hypothetical protein
MPFLNLNNNWSKLSQYYNQPFNNKPEVPRIKYTSFDDGLIRGGVLNVGLSSIRDTARIGKFFLSGKGALFILKQVGLQKSNPRLEQSQNFRALSNNNTQLYNLGLNTLTQIPINALGGHIIRHGILPVGGVGFLEGDSLNNIKGYNYEKIALENNNNGNNRLVSYLDKISSNTSGTTPTTLLSYKGGASSVYGIGNTEIKTTTLKTDFKSSLTINNNFNGDTYIGIKYFSDFYKDITNTGTLNFRQNTTNLFNQQFDLKSKEYFTRLQSFKLFKTPLEKYLSNKADQLNKEASQLKKEAENRQQQTETNYNANADADFLIKNYPEYSRTNIQSRIGVAASKYGPNGIKLKPTVDSINVIDVVNNEVFYNNSLKSNNDIPKDGSIFSKTVTSNTSVNGFFGRDIIKFRIEFLNNDAPVTAAGINTDVLAFRAYLDDFNDGMNAKWNSFRYMGRGEEFYVYEGFTRDISLSFTIYAHSPEEMRPIYRKLNYLLSSFAPDYSSQLKMRGNISYLTVGDYLYRQPGIFTDIKLSGMLDTHWEIGLDEEQYELPKHIKVALSFKPIHTFLPRKVQPGKYADTPFITLDKNAYPAQAGQTYKKDSGVAKPVIDQPAKNVYLD